MDEQATTEICRICGHAFNENDGRIRIQQDRSVENIKKCAKLRGLEWANFVKKGDSFHGECRNNFTKKDRITPAPVPENNRPKTRRESAESTKSTKFDYRTCCLFCCETICDRGTDKDRNCVIKPRLHNDVSFVKSKTWFDTSIRKQVKGRQDDWAQEVRGRIETVSCLRAEEAVYHRRCLQLFSLQRKRPTNDDCETTPAKRKRGMKIENDEKNEAFLKLIEYVEEIEDEHLILK